jgi:hypothetical protein
MEPPDQDQNAARPPEGKPANLRKLHLAAAGLAVLLFVVLGLLLSVDYKTPHMGRPAQVNYLDEQDDEAPPPGPPPHVDPEHGGVIKHHARPPDPEPDPRPDPRPDPNAPSEP